MKPKMIVGLTEKSITLLGPISIKELNEIVGERSLQDFTITDWHNWEEKTIPTVSHIDQDFEDEAIKFGYQRIDPNKHNGSIWQYSIKS